ncbi:hypothetical protein K491DRAFT_716602 [Lophiostoma macrostomum CBS 122681]|uniref:F-box domain-containing protein n=1 Tax=Lophiostoma macrostomum CBS 122681 TaxID=1314788 RepID=A0A6A6T714_9PLEO|nr:hypothetical protein K491DRAFT_716602 [Lophiostoma macrostomum CBS 122681]
MHRRSERLAPTKRAQSGSGAQSTTSKRKKTVRIRIRIDDLPVKILSRIFSNLPRTNKTYRSLALVSRVFNQATAPLQYQRFRHKSARTSSAFLFTLINRPDYTKFVKELDLIPSDLYPWNSEEEQTGDSVWLEPMKTKRVSRLPQGLEMAMIMCQTTNVECLSVAMSDKDMLCTLGKPQSHSRLDPSLPLSLWPLVNLAIGQWSSEVHTFLKLRKLTLNMRGMRSEAASLLLRIPSLRDLTLDELRDHHTGRDTSYFIDNQDIHRSTRWNCPAGTSWVSRLRFSDARVDGYRLKQFIQSCKKLQVLSYHHIPQDENEDPSFDGYGWITQALQKYSATLEYFEVEDDLVGTRDHLCLPTTFENLKYVRAPLRLLFGVYRREDRVLSSCQLLNPIGILPHKLETLRLQIMYGDEVPDMYEWLISLALACAGHVQNVIIDFWSEAFGSDHTNLIRPEKLRRVFNRHGVNFDYVIDISNPDMDSEHTAWLFKHLDEHSTECRKHAYDERCDIHNYNIPLPRPLCEPYSDADDLNMETSSQPDQKHVVRCGLMEEHPETENDEDADEENDDNSEDGYED